jgi:hypothetical protein
MPGDFVTAQFVYGKLHFQAPGITVSQPRIGFNKPTVTIGLKRPLSRLRLLALLHDVVFGKAVRVDCRQQQTIFHKAKKT